MSFEITLLPEGEHTVIALKDLSTGTFVEIYSFGALLNKFSVLHKGIHFNVIDGFIDVADAKQNITPYFKSAKLSPYVCRVKDAAYSFGEKVYNLTKYSAPPNAIHGLIYDASFAVSGHHATDTHASVRLTYLYDTEMDGFPFRYSCTVEYILETGNALTVKTSIANASNKLMPVTDGWHPYFTLGDTIDDYQVEFQSTAVLEFDELLIPTGNTIPYEEFGSLKAFGSQKFDNCFALNFAECQPMCVIRNPKKNIQIEFHPDKSYPYLQIYTPDSRKSIAIENLSAAPDAFNNGIGLRVLSPNEEAIFTTKFIVKSV